MSFIKNCFKTFADKLFIKRSITISKMRNLCSGLLIKRLLTSVFVLVNGMVLYLIGQMVKCLIACLMNRFPGSYNVKYFKEIKRLKSLQKVEAHLEPKRASTMELFCEYT